MYTAHLDRSENSPGDPSNPFFAQLTNRKVQGDKRSTFIEPDPSELLKYNYAAK